jgi:hypothetical protein
VGRAASRPATPARLTPFEEELVDALRDLIDGMRDDGAIVKSSGEPYEGHRIGCECGICAGVRLVAFAEGGGRCIVCGCTDDAACASGCAWADAAHYVCTGHPPAVIRAAERLVAKRAKEVARRG